MPKMTDYDKKLRDEQKRLHMEELLEKAMKESEAIEVSEDEPAPKKRGPKKRTEVVLDESM